MSLHRFCWRKNYTTVSRRANFASAKSGTNEYLICLRVLLFCSTGLFYIVICSWDAENDNGRIDHLVLTMVPCAVVISCLTKRRPQMLNQFRFLLKAKEQHRCTKQ